MFFFFFFSSRRRHTRWNCDWSSDVCSSDLAEDGGHLQEVRVHEGLEQPLSLLRRDLHECGRHPAAETWPGDEAQPAEQLSNRGRQALVGEGEAGPHLDVAGRQLSQAVL